MREARSEGVSEWVGGLGYIMVEHQPPSWERVNEGGREWVDDRVRGGLA